MSFDVVLRGGRVFDGSGGPSDIRDVGITGDFVEAISRDRLDGATVIDCAGRWVMPGFVDLHTHYDAEVELAPSLSESVRHGVTTVMLGSCSLSLALGEPDDLADMFCRVEAIPDEVVRPLLRKHKTWEGHASYFEHLDTLALGANVASFVGHSAVRAHVMGIERSLDGDVLPTEVELSAMERIVSEALDCGYVGMSVQTLPWDKMGGDRPFRSRPLPSTYAKWSEYQRMTRVLRERGRVFQGVPNMASKLHSMLFFIESMGLVRKPLRTTIISLMDLRAAPIIRHFSTLVARVANALFDADFRWQTLPEPFDLWADGIDLVVFEEFGAGAAALHLREHAARVELFADPEYRRRFRREWTSRFLPKAFHRDFNESLVLACPDGALVGKSFAEIAKERAADAVDTFLDLIGEHGTKLRWYTVMANGNRRAVEEMIGGPDILIGFSDAGAHLRQMAHYNFPLRMLRLVRDAEARGEPFMSVERAVHRLTGEIADWFGIDAGSLKRGSRADVVVVNPSALSDDVDEVVESPMDFFDGLSRLVRRNDAAVDLVLIGGKSAIHSGVPSPELGKLKMGRVLRANDRA